ncbi:ABC transporter permease [Micromonospora sp. NPDC004704]
MTWLTWRQFRIQAWMALAALAALVVALTVTGPNLARLSRTTGLAACQANCTAAADSFVNEAMTVVNSRVYVVALVLMFVLPGIIGVFWGAPLIARELETGTHRLIWNQSVTRTRWLAVKLVGVGLVSMATAGVFSLAVTWWAAPIDKANLDRMLPLVFPGRGIVPIGYAAFAFVVGVTAGMLVRRTIPAMAVTLVVIVAALVASPLYLRPHLVTPVSFTAPLDTSAMQSVMISETDMMVTGQVNQPGAWVVSNTTVTPSGQPFTGPADPQTCGRKTFSKEGCMAWLASLDLRQQASYQPASRFWALQWYETAVFLALSVLLSAFCFWWVRRRLA